MAGCYECERPYGAGHGFPDLLIPSWAWKRISPRGIGSEGGLLCPSCICLKLHEAGIECEGTFASGPITSMPYDTFKIDVPERGSGHCCHS